MKRKEKVKTKVKRKKDKKKDGEHGDTQGKTARDGISSNWIVSVGKILFRRTLGAHYGTNSFRKHIEPGEL